MKDLIKRILREETKGELNNRARHLLGVMAAASLKNVADGDIESMRNALKDVEESGIDWNKDVVKSVKQTYDDLMLRAKQILREEKKKLFIPRKIVERDVEFERQVKKDSDKFLIDNDIKSLNYIVKVNQLWDNLDYDDISNAFWNNTNCEVIFNNGEKWVNSYSWTKISHLDFIDYSHIMSAYLSKLINKHNPEDLVLDDLEIEVYCVVGKINMDFYFTKNMNYKLGKTEVVSFSKTL
jgi:hypothetical protein